MGGRPGQRAVARAQPGLPKDSVANVSQIVTIDRTLLSRNVGRLSQRQLDLVFAGIDIVFDP